MKIYRESIRSRLSLAVNLRDDTTPDKKITGDVYLGIKGLKKQPVRHQSGYFLFVDLPEGKYILTAGGKNYAQENFEVDTRSINKQKPFFDHTLERKKNYSITESPIRKKK